MTPEQYIQKLIELSEKKLSCVNEILDLTKKQSDVISEDSVNILNELTDQKQQQINLIDSLDQEFEVYFLRLKSVLGVESLEEIEASNLSGTTELKEIVTKIFDKIKEIQSLENVNKDKVQEVLDKLAADIRRVKQHKMVNNGYNLAAKLPKPSYFFDRKK